MRAAALSLRSCDSLAEGDKNESDIGGDVVVCGCCVWGSRVAGDLLVLTRLADGSVNGVSLN